MRKRTKLYVLLGVLVGVCAAAFGVSRYQEKQEDIKNSGETILEIPTDSVTALSWANETGTFSFTKGDGWTYDDDSAFPVSEEKINDLLSQFEGFEAAFVIDDVEDYSQYGLDDPVCTITITTDEQTYTVELGDFSTMDEQRYISIGDGKAYLVSHDPLDEYGAVLSDVIQGDEIPSFVTADQITFRGDEEYTVTRDEDGESMDSNDVYFTDGKPLDTDNVDSLLSSLKSLALTTYVTYNATDEDLASYYLDDPDQTIEVSYSGTIETVESDDTEDTDGTSSVSSSSETETAAESTVTTEETGTISISLSRNPEEYAAYEEAVSQDSDELPEVSCYARVGDSPIIYQITQSEYNALTAVSYNTLRHQELFTADLSSITSVDVTLDGQTYTFAYTAPEDADDEDAEGTWTYGDTEFDGSALESALTALNASSFTVQEPDDEEEISLTIHLDNENLKTLDLTLYRYDGSSCIASVDGEPTALVSRSQTVDLIEAVNAVTLGDQSE